MSGLGLDTELLWVDHFEVITALVLDLVADWLTRGVAQLDRPGDFFSQNALENDRLLFRSVKGKIDVQVQDEKKHLSLKRTVNVFGSDVVLHSNISQVLAKDLSVAFEVVLWGTYHFHFLQGHYVGIFLNESPDHCAILKVLVEVGQSALLQQHLSYCLLSPVEENVFRRGGKVGLGEVVGWHFS